MAIPASRLTRLARCRIADDVASPTLCALRAVERRIIEPTLAALASGYDVTDLVFPKPADDVEAAVQVIAETFVTEWQGHPVTINYEYKGLDFTARRRARIAGLGALAAWSIAAASFNRRTDAVVHGP